MARSRMIKPDFWDDEKLATQTSRDSRLVFIGLWNLSDDFAVVKGNIAWLKNKIFPYDADLSIDLFTTWMNELENGGWILPFEYHSERYYYIRNFLKHQTINKPSWSVRNPEPPSDITENTPLPEHYGSVTEPLRSKAEAEQKQKLNKSRSKAEGEATATLPFENAFSALLIALKTHDQSKKSSVMQRQKAAESLVDEFGDLFVLEKITHFEWLLKHCPERVERNPTGYLIRSIRDRYPPPVGYEEWLDSQKTKVRKQIQESLGDHHHEA